MRLRSNYSPAPTVLCHLCCLLPEIGLSSRRNGSFQLCKDNLIHELKEVQKAIGEAGGPMNRGVAIGHARSIAETLLIHILRRRHANGSRVDPTRPPTTRELGCVDGLDQDGKRSWFYRKRDEVRQDIASRKSWLQCAPWKDKYDHLTRLLNCLEKIRRDSNKFHHPATSDEDLQEATADDVQQMLIEPLNEVFCASDLRQEGKRSRILV